MYIKKTQGYVMKRDEIAIPKKSLGDALLDILESILNLFLDKNVHYLNWIAIHDDKLCADCAKMHGKVYDRHDLVFPLPPLHPCCRCIIWPIETMKAGTITNQGVDGADWWLKNEHQLPDYYITIKEAKALGYVPQQGNLGEVAPGKTIARGLYHNHNGHLPQEPGRIWYEADINYDGGFRNDQRILYSNDGLIFVTLDHYDTFIEVI